MVARPGWAAAELDRRLVPVLAGRLRTVVTRVHTVSHGMRDDVRRQQAVLRDARRRRRIRALRPALHADSQRVLGGLALVLLAAAAALLVVGG